MKMKTVKVSEVSGPALDWLVAKIKGEDYLPEVSYDGIGNEYPATRYSTDWSQCGPIIEREHINVIHTMTIEHWVATKFVVGEKTSYNCGETPLIAAMRCFVASKLGDTVKVPVEL